MCGRFVRTSSVFAIAGEFDVMELPEHVDEAWLAPSYNIAPGRDIVAVINGKGKRLSRLRWGLIPSWSGLPKGRGMINARAETVREKPSFRDSFMKRRCIIPADGFYEWRKIKNTTTPFYFSLSSGIPFGLAGIYDTWTSPEGKDVGTCAIITTVANELISTIYQRMPVIVGKDNEAQWLDQSVKDPAGLLLPYPATEMLAYEVSSLVNSPQHDSPDCILPVSG